MTRMPLSDVSFTSGLGRHAFGNSHVQYTDDGRLVSEPSDISAPVVSPRSRYDEYPDFNSQDGNRERLHQINAREARDREYGRNVYDNRRPVRHGDRPRYDRNYHDMRQYDRNYNRDHDRVPGYGRTLPPPVAPGPPARRYDNYRSRDNIDRSPNYDRTYDRTIVPNYDWRRTYGDNYGYDKTGLIAAKNYEGKYGLMAKRKVVKSPRPISIIFIITGILLLCLAIIDLVICVDHHYYCRFWVGAFVVELGVIGLIHGGKYKQGWRNKSYIFVGIIVTILAFVCTSLIFWSYIPQLKLLTQTANYTEYIELVKADGRKSYTPTVSVETRTNVCLGLDSAALVVVLFAYLALPAIIEVGHRYWNYKHDTTNTVEPYCRPQLFNPYVGMIVGECMIFIGILVAFACEGTKWYTYWSPVWAGVILILAGAVAAWASKTPARRSLAFLGLVANLIGIVATITAVVLGILGMSENISKLSQGKLTSGYEANRLYASAIVQALSVSVCLVGFFYCLGLMVRLGYFLTHTEYEKEEYSNESQTESSLSTIRDRYGYDHANPPLPYRANTRAGWFHRR